MNTTLRWIDTLRHGGHDAVHWSSVGADDACDVDIMRWARDSRHAVLTKDLDFGTELARSGAMGPSVVLLRTKVDLPAYIGAQVIHAIAHADDALREGALLVIADRRTRLRPLPLSRSH